MTLSEFLRSYLYIPLGGNRVIPIRRYGNLIIVMLIGGLWHGPAWTFVFWGGLHGSYLLANHVWRDRVAPATPKAFVTVIKALRWPITFLAVVVAWVFFRAPSFTAALNVIRGMAGLTFNSVPGEFNYFLHLPTSEFFGLHMTGLGMSYGDLMLAMTYLFLACMMAFFAPNTAEIFGLMTSSGTVPIREYRFSLLKTVALGIMLWLAAFGVIGSTPSEFLYFQF